jgi:HlyD family secretion protein
MDSRPKSLALVQRQAVFLACLVLVAGCNRPKNPPSSQGGSPGKVPALGRIEPASGIITVSLPVGDRLEEVLVKEGQEVKAGKVLARLASAPVQQQELKLAETQVKEANDRLKAIDANGANQRAEAEVRHQRVKRDLQTEIEILKGKQVIQKKQLEAAQAASDRLTRLPPGSVPEQDVERQKLAAEQAEAELESTKKMLAKAEAGLKSTDAEAEAQKKTLESTIEQARSQVPLASAERQLELARERQKLSQVLAPRDGTILAIVARPGEIGGTRPLLRMADLSELVVVAEVFENEALLIRDGQPAEVSSKALTRIQPLKGQSLKGKVIQVSAMVERNQVNELNPAALSDRRVVIVKVLLDFSSYGSEQKVIHDEVARLLNLQVDVAIEVKPEDSK